MRKIMAIFAHPDDENAVAGTLIHYIQQGNEVTLVCATRGEVGEISDPTLATPETLGQVRQKELETACDILNIKHLEFLDYRDSGMDGTDENNDPRAYVQADPTEAIGQLVGLIRQYQPDIVITFEPFGWYGHPDHKITSKWVTEAYPLVNDATHYPDRGDAWQPQALYHAVISFSSFKPMIDEAIELGYIKPEDFGFEIPEEMVKQAEEQITHEIDVSAYYDQADSAMQAHQTQFGEDSPFRKIPDELSKKYGGYEHFTQVYPAPTASEARLTDLFIMG